MIPKAEGKLHIIVCIKQILDPEIPPRNFQVDQASKKVIPGDAALVINPFDVNAIEIALQLKDRQKNCTVTVLTLGGEPCGKALRHALAMGCDEAIWLKDAFFEGLDSAATAKVIARAIQKMEQVDLVLCGRQAGDWDMGQIGSLIAEELSWPCLTVVSQVTLENDRLRWQREVEKGVEIVATDMPALATITSSSANQPRYATTKGIVLASRRKIPTWSAQDLGISEKLARLIVVEDVTVPSYERQIQIIEGEDGMIKGTRLAQVLAAMKVLK
ncbi:MAG: electron transfer flavoprotein subunit beta/FixA family protein [Deltaproteobacteria bacterium]|nr:electron transfer flavoprotein subunit beta/FixA family protein [Deltaproteobacteria bacterium]